MTANAYCTAAEVKAVMPDSFTTTDTDYDTLLGTLASRASRAIDRFCKRDSGAFYADTDETRYFDGSGMDELLIDELAAAPTSLSVAEDGINYTDWTTEDYILWPYNRTPYTRILVDMMNGAKSIFPKFPRAVKIVGKFGYSVAVPDDIKQAAIIMTVRYFKRGQQGFNDVGAVVELGQLRYVDKLDPDVAAILLDGGYVRMMI